MNAEKHGSKSNKTANSISAEYAGGSFSTSGKSILGVDSSASGEYKKLSGEINKSFNGTGNVKFDEKGKVDEINLLDASVNGKGSVVSGKVSGSYGIGSIDSEGSVLSVNGKAGAKIKIYEKGKFAPQLAAEAKVSGDVAKGRIGATIGSSANNVHANASGELGHGEAYAGIGVGKITYEDENGQTQTGYGAYAEAGAEAYLAKGTLSGGVTICGVKIDASVDFKAGGGGAKAEAEVQTGKMKAGLGLGFLVGLGINVSIDWSEFQWPGSDKKTESSKSSAPAGNGRADFAVYPQKLKSDAQTLQAISAELKRLSSQVDTIKDNLKIDGVPAVLLKKQMNSIVSDMKEQEKNFANLSKALEGISHLYADSENTVISSAQ